MKRISRKHSKKAKIIGLTALTLALSCVFVVAFFAIKTGSIFGMFRYETPYVTGGAVDIPKEKIQVTSAESGNYTSILEADAEATAKFTGLNTLPEIPKAEGTRHNRGTKDNPFVILEIVPELAQQSLSYFAGSKEEGLPFDPLDLSIQLSKKNGNSEDTDKNGTYLNQIELPYTDGVGHIKECSWNKGDLAKANLSWVENLGGVFEHTNMDEGYDIYNPDGTVVGASKKTSGEDYDYARAPLIIVDSYFTVNMELSLETMKKLSTESNGNKVPTIAGLYDSVEEFKNAFVDKAGQEIPRKVIEDNKNWAWKEATNSERVIVYDSNVKDVDFSKDIDSLGKKEFIEKYSEYFVQTEEGTQLNDENFDFSNWSYEKKEQRDGYFVYVGENNGDWNTSDEWNAVFSYVGDNKGSWKYSKTHEADAKEGITDLNGWNQYYNSTKEMGEYVSLSMYSVGDWRIKENGCSTEEWKNSKKLAYNFKFNYKDNMYKISFEYVGLKWNDNILKRMLFNLKSDKQYDEYYIKIIAVTPAMINAMDKNDTPDSVGYIERADMFYVSSYFGQSAEEAKSAEEANNLRSFYYNYIDIDNETVPSTHRTDSGKPDNELANFEENDLDWIHCMKIIKRLSSDRELPMMYSKQMGYYLQAAKDNVCNLLYDSTYAHNVKANMCNLSKMYLITTVYDLSAKVDVSGQKSVVWSFMDKVYDSIQMIHVDKKSADNTVEYTGYYREPEEGSLGNCSSHFGTSEQDKDYKYAYLWNINTFIPYYSTSSEDSIYDTSGNIKMSELAGKYGFLSSATTAIYPEDVHGKVQNNVSLNGYKMLLETKGASGDYMQTTGTRDPLNDEQNVTIVMAGDMNVVTLDMEKKGEGVAGTYLYTPKQEGYAYENKEPNANANFTIIHKGVMSRIAVVLQNILKKKNDDPSLKFEVDSSKPSKKYYQKLSDDSILIDYSMSASYDENNSQEKNIIKVYCVLKEVENNLEDSILRSIKLENPNDTSKSKTISKIYDFDGNLISWEDGIKFSEEASILDTDPLLNAISGYRIKFGEPYKFVIPISLKDWQDGYTQIRVDWVGRTHNIKTKRASQTPKFVTESDLDETTEKYKQLTEDAGQYAIVDIGERELFDLE